MASSSDQALFIDFGSTFTKAVLVDSSDLNVLGRVQTPSTVDTDITVGLNRALDEIGRRTGRDPSQGLKLASSSAAGGLKLAAIGLVPDLTVEAAKRAALGAGAKVVGVYAFKLNDRDIRSLVESRPDIVLLAGGTDGGDRENALYNAGRLAQSDLSAPIVFAGNKDAADEASGLLEAAGKNVVVAANVMPEIGRIEVDEVRTIIRELFIGRIVDAKGFKKAEDFIDRILMPTPTAVLAAARLLAEGAGDRPGLGELMVVDIGGATTDVHSVASGAPTDSTAMQKGLPEPYVKRTVEGDLGMRYNAATIVSAAGREAFQQRLTAHGLDLDTALDHLIEHPERLPDTDADRLLDVELAKTAASLAVTRHAGRIESTYGPHGRILIQYGKDLRGIQTVIAAGGPLIFGPDPKAVLVETLYRPNDPFSLKPENPRFLIDDQYLLYAVGLWAESRPDLALGLAQKYLTPDEELSR